MKGATLVLVSYLIHAAHAGIFSKHASKDDNASVPDDVKAADMRFDYKLSFKEPLYYNDEIPFWNVQGDVIKASDRVRLAPSVPGQKGAIWSAIPNEHDEWQVDMKMSIAGSQVHGGRGLAFWYTKDRMEEGPIFGSKDAWDGLSIWFDSANPKTHTPTIMAFLNDGHAQFASAGIDPSKRLFGECKVDYRNTFMPALVRITYRDNTLTLLIDPSSNGAYFHPCFQQTNVILPKGYYFGVSAASSNPADDHDVSSFETFQLNPPARVSHKKRPKEDELNERGQQFTELSDEHRKKIEEAEFEVRRLRGGASGGGGGTPNMASETSATLGIIFDTQQRMMENVLISQLQLEALGAPSPEKVLTHDFSQPINPGGAKNADAPSPPNGLSLDQLKTEAASIVSRLEQQSVRYEEQIRSLQDTMGRVETLIQTLDKRLTLQSSNIHGKLSEITKESAEAKGTLSSLVRYIIYAIGLQAVVGFAVYAYYKVRVEKNEKKFL
ncbi:hypothetical protein DM01DRAFT_1339460 [Hesseltinella vesiculosa]|uniref:L-type lectin-like domain-containing protein n=1 Tax=Hesseltinella vesiculosa TaxID=101127 RepID=A0A1X2G7A3_9FUNG|nr:hypothetical protein DM01DRAFT_1339460 [Hesseltinella vesiculosa]